MKRTMTVKRGIPTGVLALGGKRVPLTIDAKYNFGDAQQHNPSVLATPHGLIANIRLMKHGSTRNVLVRLNDEFKIFSVEPLSDDTGVNSKTGFEDVRLIMLGDNLCGLAAADAGDGSRIALIRIAGGSITEARGFNSPRVEKNWMPLAAMSAPGGGPGAGPGGLGGGDKRFVYSVEPLVVLALDGYRCPTTVRDGFLRGSSQIIPLGDGTDRMFGVVHEVWETSGGATGVDVMPMGKDMMPVPPPPGMEPLVYLHRFVIFDAALKKVDIGPAWSFGDLTGIGNLGVEFCAGAAWWKDQLVLSYGWRDRQALLAVMKRYEIESLLPKG